MSNQHPESRPVTHQYELAVLGEECGKAIQVVGKTLRFGYDSHHPDNPTKTNLDLLHEELGDILAAIDFGVERGLLDREKLVTRQFYKRRALMAVAPPAMLELTAVAPEPVTPTYSTPIHTPMIIPTKSYPVEKRAVIVILACIAFMVGAFYTINWLFDDSSNEIDALHAYQTCLTTNTINPAVCNDLATTAGEPPITSPSEAVSKTPVPTGPTYRYETPHDIVKGH